MSYIGNPPVNGVFRKLDTIAASFNGSTTSFNLTSGGAAVSPGLTTNLIISLGGIIQEPNTAYTISGSTISFTAAPPAGTSFWGIQLGDVGLAQTPNQNAMTTQVFTATAGQTTFTVNGGYTVGQLQVLRNGVQLVVGVDVTATNGTTFVLTNPATAGDTIVSIAYVSFIVANAVAKSGDTMSGALSAPSITATSSLIMPAGTVTRANMGYAGAVLQVVSATGPSSDITNTSLTGTTILSLSITPTSANSKIMIIGGITLYITANSNAYGMMGVLRGSTAFPVYNTGFNAAGIPSASNGQICVAAIPFTYLDSPATTSSVTYNMQIAKNSNNTTNAIAYTNYANLVLMEIAG